MKFTPEVLYTYIIYVKDSPKIDVDPDEKVVELIDKYISCKLPDEKEDPELHEIVSAPNIQNHAGRIKKFVHLIFLDLHLTKHLFAALKSPLRRTMIKLG